MKLHSLILAMLLCTSSLFAQTNFIFGNFIKADGNKIKGTSTSVGYEGQLIISNYTGGTDKTATIEIEVPTGSYVADFRNMMNATVPSKQITIAASKTQVNITPTNVNVPKTKIIPVSQQTSFSSFTVSVCKGLNDQKSYHLLSKIILQNIIIESCTDNVSTGKTTIKMKATRIGWFYNTYEPTSGKVSGSSKSGWDTATGTAWTNF